MTSHTDTATHADAHPHNHGHSHADDDRPVDVAAEVIVTAGGLHIRQFVATALGDASYLVAAGDAAVVVDPQRDVRPYLAAASELGVTITHAVETHVHNDYVSGGPELAALGAELVAPKGSGITLPHRPVADGDEIAIGTGGARIRAVSAPGHTHHHTAYLAIEAGGEVAAAMTGGSIIIGGAGRTDLLGPDETTELTRLQWESAQRIAALLGDDAHLLPTHGAGSFCSSQDGGGQRRARLSEERPRNILLSSPDFESFRVLHLANPGPIPAYYQHMAGMNRSGPRLYGTPPLPALLTPSQVASAQAGGTPLIDVRSRHDFTHAHVPGSISIEENDSTLAYVSWVTPFNAELVLITEDARQADRLTTDLLRIGYEQVTGYLPFEAWHGEGRPVARMETVTVAQARDLYQHRALPVFDVRFDSDRRDLPLPDSLRRPIDELPEWLPDVEDHEQLVICGGGARATTSGSLLLAAGHHPHVLTDGGAADLVE